MSASEIPFTQYLFPDGRKTLVFIERPQEVVDKALALVDEGYRFECENDRGEVRLTVVDPDDEGDIAIEVANNGPDVLAAVDRLVASAGKYARSVEAKGGAE